MPFLVNLSTKPTMMLRLLCIICLCGPLYAFSPKNTQPGVYEEKAANILSEASKKLMDFDAVHMEFALSTSGNAMSLLSDTEGYIYVKGEKYYIKSGDMHFISDGVLAWTFLEDVNELHISYLEDTEGALSPISILNNFEEDFKPLWLREETHNNRKFHIIDMVPKEPHAFFKYRLGIDTETKMIVFTTAFDRQGNTYTYTITDIYFNPEIPDGFFVFDTDKYPDLEIVDLR